MTVRAGMACFGTLVSHGRAKSNRTNRRMDLPCFPLLRPTIDRPPYRHLGRHNRCFSATPFRPPSCLEGASSACPTSSLERPSRPSEEEQEEENTHLASDRPTSRVLFFRHQNQTTHHLPSRRYPSWPSGERWVVSVPRAFAILFGHTSVPCF